VALTDAFLASCRSTIMASDELATFKDSLELADSGTRSDRTAAWVATYVGTDSPAMLLRQAIRGAVNAAADASGALGLLDRESACRTLSDEFVPTYPRPPLAAAEQAALEAALLEDQLS